MVCAAVARDAEAGGWAAEAAGAGVAGLQEIRLEPGVFRAGQPQPIGTFTVVDDRVGATHVLTLATGVGDADNGKFAISGRALRPWLFDFGSQPPGTVFQLRVRATDVAESGRWIEWALTVALAVPQVPTRIGVDVASVSRRGAAGSLVARLRVEDPDPDEVHRVELVAGAGDADNAMVQVEGGDLLMARAPAAGQERLRVRLRATDGAGLFREEAVDLPFEAPVVRISEVLTGELGGVPDGSRGRKEWIEIQNAREQYESVEGWHLTDTMEDLRRWRFPARTLGPGGFLLVLADGLGVPPVGSPHLHAGFSLSSEGEWVGLVEPDGVTLASVLGFPAQFPGVSYGVGVDGQVGHLPVPTPGGPNGAVAVVGENLVRFSRGRGFQTGAFDLELEASVPGSVIRYSLDGTLPTATAGLVYGGPIRVVPSTTAAVRGSKVVRAVAVHAGAAYAPVATHTYLFVNGVEGGTVDGVVGQSRLVPAIVRHPVYGPLLDDALLALPAVALTLAGGGPTTTERVASMELFDPEGRETGFQVDCGIEVTGTTSLASPKQSMAARFRGAYGASALRYPVFARGTPFPVGAAEEFRELRLRSHSHDTFHWLGTRENPPVPYGSPAVQRSGDAQLLRNPWIDDLQLAMGQVGKRGRQVHLFLNGAYHGIYHVHERPDEDFMAGYFPGGRDDFHFLVGATTGSDHGGGDTWRVAWNALKASLGSYAQAMRWVDVTNLCDSMILSFYAGNDWDWSAQHNWSAAGPKGPDRGGWKFLQQDSDLTLQDVAADCTDQNVPDGVFSALMRFPDFRVLFRDRVYRHFFGDGVLTPGRAAAFYAGRVEEISTAIVAETARWQPSSSVGVLPWDRDEEWMREWGYLRDVFFPQRTARVLEQFRRRSGWWPVEPPVPGLAAGDVPVGSRLTFGASGGRVYATTDGSDPRLPGGGVASGAREVTASGIAVDRPMRVRARVFSGGDWSALVDVALVPAGTPSATTRHLWISEVQYHPLEAPDAEFLELLNATGEAVDLSGVTLTHAVRFRFPEGTGLGAGERVVVVKDLAAYRGRYEVAGSPYHRPGVRVFGPWAGSLSNGGERVEVMGADGGWLFSFEYGVRDRWPRRADGRGSSLELAEAEVDLGGAPSDAEGRTRWLGDAGRWRASREFHGSPGAAGLGDASRVVLNEVLAAPGPGGMDAIEILNRSGELVNVSGWYLSDASSEYRKFRLPAGLLLGGGARVVFSEADFNPPVPGVSNLVPFALSKDGEELHLVEADAGGALLRFADALEFGPMPQGVSVGRSPDGVGALAWFGEPTLGRANGPAAVGYEAWAQLVFPAGVSVADRGPGADPDGDGVVNLAEYAFGLPPMRAEGAAVWGTAGVEGGAWRFGYREGPGVVGVRFGVEISEDLRVWRDAGDAVETVGRVVMGDGSTRVEMRLRGGGGAAVFVRVGVGEGR